MSHESSKTFSDERLHDAISAGPYESTSMRSLTLALLAEGARLSLVSGGRLKGSRKESQISSAWSQLRRILGSTSR
jgi:hypothetical protein